MGRISPFAQSLAVLGGAMLLLLFTFLLPGPDIVRVVIQYLLVVVLIPAYVFTFAIWLMVTRLRKRGIRPRVDDFEVAKEEGLRQVRSK